ncbi:EAL domain-containing protein (putative c-di-GMP-specific phosphodiesterase class I) [Raoultella sp. BIGb0138]|uniref:EAL domain-containing protein n=1 Tax=Raoultella sp. BIGb0138 TaxID=2485115 RepID=UPI0010457369|nr:cyclic diguanylate phosphodiesterase [Raoultella sp. BIGb0138]TCW09408.1 EAL domain-containing protein (putative c-di-GMP-specific phosphodiesterase class I) [Raoultella sp. BIGb0138]
MKNTSFRHRLWIISFLIFALALGNGFCYWQMQKNLDADIRSRLQQSIASLDVTLSHAQQAASQAAPYLGKSCNEQVLTAIRTIVATIPDVRTVNLVNNNEIYCTSVFGGRKFKVDQAQYAHGQMLMMGGNEITPSRPLIVYSVQDQRGHTALIGIDGYYLYNILNVLDRDARLYLKVADRFMSKTGAVTRHPDINKAVELPSQRFKYSVIADRGYASSVASFIKYERNSLLVIILVALLATFLFRNYLNYRETVEYMLKQAIKLKQLQPWIQPIVNSETGVVVGGEVLVRWQHPRLGAISPDKFIAVAEQTGLIKGITDICFTEVINQFRRRAQTIPQGLFICFNTSSLNFQDHDIIALCRQFMDRLNASQVRLVLEITERESIENTRQTSLVTEKLRAMGVEFSLDDFGTGYANYSYLQQFTPEFIKIDKIFTFNILTNHASALVVKNMVNLAKKFNCQIIAEGVEEKAQIAMLKEMGIDIFQGYYFSKALTVDEYIAMVGDKSALRGK